MKCLITGISGFAGSHLAEYLLALGQQVYGTVLPQDPSLNINHLQHQITNYPCNLTNPEETELVIQDIKPDRIFHLAAQAHVPSSWANPIQTFQINLFATLYLIEAVKQYQPSARVLIIGSGDEYGNVSEEQTITETTPLNPQTPYAVTKICSDLISGQLAHYYKLHLVRVRPFPHIGPRQTCQFAISDFSRQIALIENQQQPPVIKVGNLAVKRDFTDVRDTVRAYWFALDKGQMGDVYNISSQKEWSINDILQKLLSFSGTQIKIETDPAKIRLLDIHMKKGSSQKFRNQTGWQPEIPIEQTLQDTLDWWRNQIMVSSKR